MRQNVNQIHFDTRFSSFKLALLAFIQKNSVSYDFFVPLRISKTPNAHSGFNLYI